MTVRLPRKRPDEPITASEWNKMCDLVEREVRGDGVIADRNGWLLTARGGGGGANAATPIGVLGRIVPGSQVGVGSGGSAPYLYDIYPAALTYPFSAITSLVFNGAYNIAEITGTAYGGRHLENNALVQFYQLESGVYYCEQCYFRGTYPG